MKVSDTWPNYGSGYYVSLLLRISGYEPTQDETLYSTPMEKFSVYFFIQTLCLIDSVNTATEDSGDKEIFNNLHYWKFILLCSEFVFIMYHLKSLGFLFKTRSVIKSMRKFLILWSNKNIFWHLFPFLSIDTQSNIQFLLWRRVRIRSEQTCHLKTFKFSVVSMRYHCHHASPVPWFNTRCSWQIQFAKRMYIFVCPTRFL